MICVLRKGFALVLITALALNLVACDWKKAERPLTAAGYNFQIGILAASRVVVAVNFYTPGALSNPTKESVLTALKQTSDIGQDFSRQIDATVEINPQSKAQLLAVADLYLGQIDATIAKLAPEETQVRGWLLIIRSTASAFRLAIATAEESTTPKQLKAKLNEAGEKASRAAAYRSAQDTANLITALGNIASDFTADIAAQKGADALLLREMRDKKYNAVQEYISTQLQNVVELRLKQLR